MTKKSKKTQAVPISGQPEKYRNEETRVKKIAFIRQSKNRGYTVLGINSGDGAVAYTVEDSLYARLGTPLPSDGVLEEDFADIVLADEIFRATKKALALLTYSDNNSRALKMKLLRAGFSREASDAAVEDMLRHAYINEERQLERLILSEAKTKLSGRGKFIPKLMAKGYKKSDIENVTDKLVASGELDFEEIKEVLIRKKLGDSQDSTEIKKLLYKNGFFAD